MKKIQKEKKAQSTIFSKLASFLGAFKMPLFIICYTPIDFVVYHLSCVRKKMIELYGKPGRYVWMFTFLEDFKFFRTIIKHKLPIQYFPKSEDPYDGGYFCGNKTLFLVSDDVYFDETDNEWHPRFEHPYPNALVYLARKKAACNNYAAEHNTCCEHAFFLVNERHLNRREKELIKKEAYVVTYNKKIFLERVRGLLENN